MFNEKLEKIIDLFESNLYGCRDIKIINEYSDKFGHINHPQIGYRLGEKYLILGEKEKALKHLINSSVFGLNPENFYLSTGYADSIGQSMWYLLKEYEYTNKFDKYKLYCSSFFTLSLCINGMGTEAYNSLKTRALMIDNFDKKIVLKMLSNYYYNGDDLCTEILSFSDYKLSSIGFQKAGQLKDSEKTEIWATKNKKIILSLPQYSFMNEMSESDILKISQENQVHLLNNMLDDYKNGEFEISKDEFINTIEKFRIKPRRGFASWF